MPSWRADPAAGLLQTGTRAFLLLCSCPALVHFVNWALLTDWFADQHSLMLSLLHTHTHTLSLSLLPPPSPSLSLSLTHTLLLYTRQYLHAHYWVTFNSVCWSENSFVSLLIYIVWVYRFTGVELERHVLCSEVANVMFFKLKWVVFTALGCTRCFYTSDRLWSTFSKVTAFLFSVILCIWCVIPRWDKTQNMWQTVMILKQLKLVDCGATLFLFSPWSGYWKFAAF